MPFNEVPDRRNTHSSKWDKMEILFDVSPKDGLSMWTADSDYPTAECVTESLRKAVEFGVHGYFCGFGESTAAIAWWMDTRHGWKIEQDWVLFSQGLGNAITLCLQTFSEPDDAAVIFTPVYHEFAHKIARNGRAVTECPLVRNGDTYELDLEDAQSRLTGREKLLIWCSPQNPSGRIWTVDELKAIAAFAAKNDLILISDEVHGDLIMPGKKFIPIGVAAPECNDRLVALTSASKTFNLAGLKTGNMIIPNPDLRTPIADKMRCLDYTASSLGVVATTAAYSPEGAAWVEAQCAHLDHNRKLFDAGMETIPGVHSLPLDSTYLAWVDFTGTGMTEDEITSRIRGTAKIAASPGAGFSKACDTYMRFNLATSTARVEEAVSRLQSAFGDLQ